MSFLDIRSILTGSDEQLMWRVRMENDEEAFGRLVCKWQGAIQRLCVRMLGDAQRGEDLAQEAFIKVYSKRADYRPSSKFSTYAWRVALNLCYDELRRLKRRPETPLESDCDEDGECFSLLDRQSPVESTPVSVMEEREKAELVRTALQKLPEQYRSVVVLRHFEGLKFREIAEVLEIPEGTVKSRMVEGLSLLSESLTRAFRAEETPRPAGRRKESLIL